MKKIIAVILCAMMLLSAFAMTASAEDDVITTWEELSEKHGLPYFTVYPTGKTPVLDAAIGENEYTTVIDMMPTDNSIYITTVGGSGTLPTDKYPEFIKCYISVDDNYIYFALDMQIDENGITAQNETGSDIRVTMDMTGKTEIAKVHATKYKNWNLWINETPLSEGDTGYYAKWNGVSDLGWYNGQQSKTSVFEELNAKYYGDNTDVNKNHLVYEVKISKAYAKTEYGVTEDKIEYIHFGLWSYYLAGVQARIGWGWEVSQDVSLATDLILPVNNDSYDLDDHLICIRLLDQDPATTTTTTSSATTTTTPPVVTTTTAPVTTTTTAPATTTTAAATTAAATTAATTEPSSGGCGSAMAISAAALIPALGIAFVTKKKED